MPSLNLAQRVQSFTTHPLLACLLLAGVTQLHAQNPAVVFSRTNGLTGVCSQVNMASCDYAGTVSQMAANGRGDIIASVSENGTTYLMEIPVNGGPQVNLLSGTGNPYGAHSVYVDAKDNIYYPNAGDANVLYIPFVNGAYPSGASAGSLSNCSAFPVPATQTATCKVPLSYPSSLGYYVSAGALGMDGQGNLYLMSKYAGNGYSSVNVLMKVSAKDGSFTILANNIGNDSGGQIAVNAAGDAFVVTYGSVQEFPASDYSKPIPVFSLNGPNGVQMDRNGNLFITNNGAGQILEYPYVNGTYNLPADNPFIVSNQLSSGYTGKASQGIAISASGKIAYAGDYPNSISTLTVGSLAFGNNTLNTTTGSLTLNLVFNSSVNFGSFKVSGPFNLVGNTCGTGSKSSGSNCTVTLTYSPSAAGPQLGQVAALDSTGNVLGTAVLSGVGVASTLNADPGTVSTDGKGYTDPAAIAADGLGNLFVADITSGIIYKTAPGATIAATAVVSNLIAPSAVAVDGAENLYIAETGEVVEVPYNPSTSTYGTPLALVTGLSGTTGLALDTLGNLYVADSGNARVLRLASSGGLPVGSIVTTLGTGYTKPVAVAVDSSNQNVYVADAGTGSVTQFNLLTSSQAIVLTGFSNPSGVAVDPAGSLYTVDAGKTTVTRLPFITGGLNPNFNTTLATIVTSPTAIAADSSGNLHLVDSANAVVATDARTAALVPYGNITVGQSSSVIAGVVSNGGNSNLTFSTPDFMQSGATSSFAIQSSSTCTAGGALSGGQSCTIAAIFNPQTYGTLTDTLALASTANNAGTLTLTGIGTPVLINTSIKLAVTSTGTPTYPQPLTVTATLTPASQAAANPTGYITFSVDNVTQNPSYTLAHGTASIVLNLSGGSHTVTASYSGDYFYSSSSGGPLTVAVAKSTTTTSMTVAAPYTAPTSANPGVQGVVLTATIVPPVSGTPTGTVTFYNGTTSLGTATVVPYTITSAKFTEGQASLTVNTSTLPLALGQYQITASYAGDTNYTGSASATPVPLLISNPTVALSASTGTVLGGGAPITVTATSIAGYTGTVDFSCSGLPVYSACSFSPAYGTLAPNLPAVLGFLVAINQPPAVAVPASFAAMPRNGGTLAWILLIPSALFGLLRFSRRRTLRGFSAFSAMLLLAGLASASISGCSTSTATYTTPAGTTTITLNALTSAPSAGGSTPVPDPNPTPITTLQLQLTVQR